jgi:hypothetical protein
VANTVYPKFKEALLKGTTPDMSSAGTDVRAILVDLADYTYSAAHDALDDVPAGARVDVTAALVNKTVSATGVFDADDIAFVAAAGAIILYVDTGTESTSLLFAFLDTGVTGLPITPNGGDITITWNASGIVAL